MTTTDERASLLEQGNIVESGQTRMGQEMHTDVTGIVQDIILGAADGLTVPFALAAGLSSAFSESRYIIVAVLSELAAGAISMGLGGYLSGKTEVDHYKTEKRREEHEVIHQEDDEIEETLEIFREYGLSDEQIAPICEHFKNNHEAWVEFMMKFELQLDKPDDMQPVYSALVIGGSYLLAGMIPLLPYLIIGDAVTALKYSILFTLVALFVFGILKSKVLRQPNSLKAGVETMVTGAVAAAAAFFIARLIPT
uniref:Uncharacterized protein n=1 Tax=Rhodosorus marinus TaxID=101924 RepID=A0A6T6KFH1_9RHOD|mmetsp:Transcript_13214/g.19073  ORF Transcript_13214/g.19073 Transcript_13214/m.19073 type:complete len:253 (+) Transcript_13214:109-867(+)